MLPAQCETQHKADGPSHTYRTHIAELTKMAEAAIEPWVTEAGPVEAVAPAPVSTVAFLTTMFAVEALGAACREQFSENCREELAYHTWFSDEETLRGLVPGTRDSGSHARWAQAEPSGDTCWLSWPVPQNQQQRKEDEHTHQHTPREVQNLS